MRSGGLEQDDRRVGVPLPPTCMAREEEGGLMGLGATFTKGVAGSGMGVKGRETSYPNPPHHEEPTIWVSLKKPRVGVTRRAKIENTIGVKMCVLRQRGV